MNEQQPRRSIYKIEGKFTGNFGKSLTDFVLKKYSPYSIIMLQACMCAWPLPLSRPLPRLLKQLTTFQETLRGLNVNADSLVFMSFLPTATASVTDSTAYSRASDNRYYTVLKPSMVTFLQNTQILLR